jgi:hypothetical protein
MKAATLRHSLLLIVLVTVSLSGCATTPEKQAANEQQRMAQREAAQRRHDAEEQKRSVERAANEQRRAADEQRRAVERERNDQRHETEQRRNAERDLRRKFARYSTGELKLMHARYKELSQSTSRDFNVTVNRSHLVSEADSDLKDLKRLLEIETEIERELLRRWKAGDAEAFLPEFEAITPGGKK